jgi:transcriptional regulator with XRE-family HTH domain
MARTPSEGTGKTGSHALAQTIRERREQLGMSRHELAEATAVPYPTIAQIETAYRGVSPSRLGVIARALDLDPADLYEVLTSDAASPSPPPAQRSHSSRHSTGGDDWQPNPAYASPSASLPEESHRPPGMRSIRPGPSSDVVAQVVHLLSQLPRNERLDALGQVQSQLLKRLVQEDVRRETRRPRSG